MLSLGQIHAIIFEDIVPNLFASDISPLLVFVCERLEPLPAIHADEDVVEFLVVAAGVVAAQVEVVGTGVVDVEVVLQDVPAGGAEVVRAVPLVSRRTGVTGGAGHAGPAVGRLGFDFSYGQAACFLKNAGEKGAALKRLHAARHRLGLGKSRLKQMTPPGAKKEKQVDGLQAPQERDRGGFSSPGSRVAMGQNSERRLGRNPKSR